MLDQMKRSFAKPNIAATEVMVLLALVISLNSYGASYVADNPVSAASDAGESAKSNCQNGGVDNRISACERAYAQGDREAGFVLARLFSNGWGGAAVDHVRATQWIEKLAIQGSGIARWQLGVRYFCGVGLEQSPAKAFSWFDKAANAGVSPAFAWRGYASERGIGTKQNFSAAAAAYRNGVSKKQVDALVGAAFLALADRASASAGEVIEWLKVAQNEVLDDSYMGSRIYISIGVIEVSEARPSAQKQRKILGELQGQVDSGNSAAALNLAIAMMAWADEKPDMTEFLALVRKAAAQKNALGEFVLGQAFLRGWGTRKDEVQAAGAFLSAAEHGDARAMFAYGWMRLQGVGVPKDAENGMRWIERAAKANDRTAQLMFSILLLQSGEAKRKLDVVQNWRARSLDCSHVNDF